MNWSNKYLLLHILQLRGIAFIQNRMKPDIPTFVEKVMPRPRYSQSETVYVCRHIF
jgi:hypothetical protein